jgi:hypothetical protein
MKRLTKFKVKIVTSSKQYNYVVNVGKPKPDWAVYTAINDLQQTDKIGYEHIDEVWVTNTVGNMCLIRDVYDWAKHHDFAEIYQA